MQHDFPHAAVSSRSFHTLPATNNPQIQNETYDTLSLSKTAYIVVHPSKRTACGTPSIKFCDILTAGLHMLYEALSPYPFVYPYL